MMSGKLKKMTAFLCVGVVPNKISYVRGMVYFRGQKKFGAERAGGGT